MPLTNPPDDTSRLIPTPPQNRLVPVTMIINAQPNNNTISRPANNRKSSLPLRGPIEMEPDEAPLLSQ